MGPNFTACAATFLANTTLYHNYTYTGSTTGGSLGQSPDLLTLEGCYDLCGHGNEYYPWTQASTTILTWIMPMLALLVKAPYGAGSPFKKVVLNSFRWIGSPIVSLAYIFWNIKVTGKCALMADMAVPYDSVPEDNSDYADVRDSLLILSIMNQYSVRTGLPSVEAEQLLRIALFSDTLKLQADERETLPMKRRKLAYRLRAGRRQGLVPVFISTAWFMFGMSISLQRAFGDVGANATAHDLAIGINLGWFPVLILCSIVDRSPWATDEVRIRLNNLLDAVREALLTEELRNTYMHTEGRSPDDFEWTQALRSHNFMGSSGFFTGFAGQGRVRWHYGVANPILTGIEEAFVAHSGRGWLGNSRADIQRARTAMVLGPKHGHALEGLRYFDKREVWTTICAVCMVAGPVIGAFTISYFTPTVGRGCRSGGYLIFFIVAFADGFFEALAWWLLPEETPTSMRDKIEQRSTVGVVAYIGRLMQRGGSLWHYNPRRLLELAVLRPIELTNTAWLVYTIMAQTFGSYNNCFCQASTWGGAGGYIDFEDSAFYLAHGVTIYWAIGTGLSLFFMVSGIAYIVAEWLTQSHLNTTNYAAAGRGLRRTRAFKKWTLWLRIPIDLFLTGFMLFWDTFHIGGSKGHGRRSLVWAWKQHASGVHSEAKYAGAAYVRESQTPPIRGSDEAKKGANVQVVKRPSLDRYSSYSDSIIRGIW